MFRKSLVVFVLIVLCLTVAVSTSFAASVNLTGTIGAGDPTMPVVAISTPNCTAQLVTPVAYHIYPFTVDVNGTYNFSMTSAGGFASLYLFQGSFNPQNAFPTCIAGANGADPLGFSENLTVGVQYFAVPFDDQFAQLGGSYSLTIDGPGSILVGDQTACTYPLLAGSVVYDVPAGAPAFYEADLNTKVNFDLPAGTWKIMEFSGDFAKVWISCQGSPIWIPRNAIGQAIG